MQKMKKNENLKYWAKFVGKSLLYTAILLGLIYLYHYSHVGGGSFIYNQF
ncbi:teichoic acid D-Ala incorporation-associated protein DltX [Vagococcus sp.]